MAPLHARPARARFAGLAVLLATMFLAGCQSSGTGVKTQTTTSNSPSTSTGTTASTQTASDSTSPPTRPPTTDFGTAQPAVDMLLRLEAAYASAVRDPAHSSTKAFDLMLAGQAKDAFDASFTAAKSSGVFYKGTPPAARIKILANQVTASIPHVELVNCPLASATDPFIAYYTATGKRVPVGAPKVPTPYAQTAKVFKVNGQWVITQFTTDNSKTCRP